MPCCKEKVMQPPEPAFHILIIEMFCFTAFFATVLFVACVHEYATWSWFHRTQTLGKFKFQIRKCHWMASASAEIVCIPGWNRNVWEEAPLDKVLWAALLNNGNSWAGTSHCEGDHGGEVRRRDLQTETSGCQRNRQIIGSLVRDQGLRLVQVFLWGWRTDDWCQGPEG